MLRETEIRIGLLPAIENNENGEIFVTECIPFDLTIDLNAWIQIAFLPPEGMDRGEILFKPRRQDDREVEKTKPLSLTIALQSRTDRHQDEFFITEKLGFHHSCNLRDTACVLSIPEEGNGTLTFMPRALAPRYARAHGQSDRRGQHSDPEFASSET